MARPDRLGEGSTVVKAEVPAAIAAALGALEDLTGATRATVLRQVIYSGLAPYALVSPEVAAALPTTTYTTTKETNS